ncbi:nitric-oxide reductase large subunit [bacterium]|nr:nitric-oxide reductase large subunit [bacterium]
MRYTRHWIALGLVILASFAVLGYYGGEIYRQAPPIPERVVTTDGSVVFTGEDIRNGQNVWQSMGGQEVGSIWGHGSYVAPDWSADWLHREAVYILDEWARAEQGKPYAELEAPVQAALRERLKAELRTNSYDPATETITVSPVRARAIAAVGAHYDALFGEDPAFAELRDAYAVPANSIKTAERRREINAFFFWTAWACATNRPGQAITYTNNWPAEELIGNRPSGSVVVWSVISFVLLLAGVGALAWFFAAQKKNGEEEHAPPGVDPLLGLSPTPSMKATLKYFWVVAALIVAQVGLGAITAHYGVEGSGFYGIPLDRWLPYSVARTWHTQLGIFWIATAWLATGLFMAPAVSGHEPRFQRAGVNFLFIALLVIVVGSMAGQWLAVQQRLGNVANFWFGHQGYEYVDLGRFWQIFLFVGLFLWLGLMVRAMWPAFKKPDENKHLLALFLVSSLAIALFYGAGLMWGRQTNLAIAEYWRWWVVHLWVEGFFEVFATVVIAFLFTRMGLLRAATATAAVLFSTVIFLSGGIIGTFHHLYFTGTPTPVLALGATFSALEVVPLVLIGFEAYENLTLSRARAWLSAYRWPIYFFVSVAFWNLVGAGLFGFLINPPIALYYMQGLNTTPVHGHTALFGVYGMLGIGLMLFCLKGLAAHQVWRTGALCFSFWAVNVGLALMVLISVLPVGLLQTWASVEHGMWYARSAEFMQTPLMDTLRWLRVIGDTIFAVGILALGWFVVGLKSGWSLTGEEERLGEPLPRTAGD